MLEAVVIVLVPPAPASEIVPPLDFALVIRPEFKVIEARAALLVNSNAPLLLPVAVTPEPELALTSSNNPVLLLSAIAAPRRAVFTVKLPPEAMVILSPLER